MRACRGAFLTNALREQQKCTYFVHFCCFWQSSPRVIASSGGYRGTLWLYIRLYLNLWKLYILSVFFVCFIMGFVYFFVYNMIFFVCMIVRRIFNKPYVQLNIHFFVYIYKNQRESYIFFCIYTENNVYFETLRIIYKIWILYITAKTSIWDCT